MVLIICPACDHQISDRAATCPHCGYPMQSVPQTSSTGQQTALADVPVGHDTKDLGADQEKELSSPSTGDSAVWLGRCLGAWLVWTIWCFLCDFFDSGDDYSWVQKILLGMLVAFMTVLWDALTGPLIPSMAVHSGKTFAKGFREGIGLTVGYLAFIIVGGGLIWLVAG
jgi:hypothetical protein